jgi:cystathionine beta-lyase
MEYCFDEIVDRRSTDAIKWSTYPDDVIPMWVADMDFRSAEPIIRALRERIEHGIFGYTRPAPDLRRALQDRVKTLYQWEIHEGEILFLTGIVSGLNIAFQAFAGPGEAVLAQPPVYFHFLRDPVLHGRVLMDPPLVRKGDIYEIDFEKFEKAITQQTRLFVLCNPHNPVGRVYTRRELEKIAEICLRYRLVICSDEIHCDLVYSGFRHIPIATLSPEVSDQTITLMAPSKTYNVAGLDCGFAIMRSERLRRIWQNTSYGIISGVNILGYVAALAALREGQDWLNQVMGYLESNRDHLAAYIREKMPSMRMCKMEATYLAWLDCSQTAIPGNPAQFFLKEARVGLNNGPDFGKGGEGFVRLNFACPRSTLIEALERMSTALGKL